MPTLKALYICTASFLCCFIGKGINMLNIDEWISNYKKVILDNFKDRIKFIGLQGSYVRDEATEDSDIDVVVIFDTLSVDDLIRYDRIIAFMPYREKICGFLSGVDEIINWEKSDLFQFYNDTKAIYGSIDFLLPLIKKENVRQAVLIGSCNIYHACCHNIIHEKSFDILKALYKQSVFVLQVKHFCDTDCYVVKKIDLFSKLKLKDMRILKLYFNIKTISEINQEEFYSYSNELFTWSGKLIKEFSV